MSELAIPRNHHDEPLMKVNKIVSNKPKRALTAYNFFFQEERRRLLQQRPNSGGKGYARHRDPTSCSSNNLVSIIAAKWKSIDPITRAYYEDRAATDKIRYDTEMLQWNEDHTNAKNELKAYVLGSSSRLCKKNEIELTNQTNLMMALDQCTQAQQAVQCHYQDCYAAIEGVAPPQPMLLHMVPLRPGDFASHHSSSYGDHIISSPIPAYGPLNEWYPVREVPDYEIANELDDDCKEILFNAFHFESQYGMY